MAKERLIKLRVVVFCAGNINHQHMTRREKKKGGW